MKTNKASMKPPLFVTGTALDVWHETIADIDRTGIAAGIEAHALGCYCRAVADLAQAQDQLDRDGLVVKTERGYVKHPATTLKAAAMDQIYRFGNAFGLTPASRQRAAYSRRQNLNP
jgi:P27 family predicted phage terminase small subunit